MALTCQTLSGLTIYHGFHPSINILYVFLYESLKKIYPRDDGVFAAMLGYDAINASGHGASNSYTVVLNRTKVILSEQRVRV